jgi:hypothetical protein
VASCDAKHERVGYEDPVTQGWIKSLIYWRVGSIMCANLVGSSAFGHSDTKHDLMALQLTKCSLTTS